jgi:hypothetical protein
VSPLPFMWCPLPPCRVRGMSEPPNNGAQGFTSKVAYLDHVTQFHEVMRAFAPEPLHRGDNPADQYRYIFPSHSECLGCSHDPHEPGKCTSLTHIFRTPCRCTDTRTVHVWASS